MGEVWALPAKVRMVPFVAGVADASDGVGGTIALTGNYVGLAGSLSANGIRGGVVGYVFQ